MMRIEGGIMKNILTVRRGSGLHTHKGGALRRFFVVAAASAAALAIPASVAIGGLASPAGAAGSTVHCGKIKGSATGTITLKKCTPKSTPNKSASFQASALETGAGTITWSTSNQTTLVHNIVDHAVSPNACPAGSDEYTATGSVSGGTSTYTKVGDVFSATVCVKTKNLTIKNLPGTSAAL
jgi:hypothetical protein